MTYNALNTLVASAVFDLDATVTNSYGGSGQTWSNLITAPADGSAQTDYDFYLGNTSSATTDDPTFTGSAGSAAAYFLEDGGDKFTLKSGVNPTFIENLHKTTPTTPFWMAVAFQCADETGSHGFIRTNTVSSQLGILLNISSAETVALFQGDGTTAKATTAAPAITIGNDYLIIVSYDGTTFRRWINTIIKASQSFAFNTATGAATNKLTLFLIQSSGFRVYAAAMGNAFIDDADASAIFYEYEERHARSYGTQKRGKLAVALGTATSTAAGTVRVAGAANKTLGAVTQTSAGTVKVSGVFNKALGTVIVSAAGAVKVTAVLAKSLGAVSLAAAGVVKVSGGAAQSLSAATLASTGTEKLKRVLTEAAVFSETAASTATFSDKDAAPATFSKNKAINITVRRH